MPSLSEIRDFFKILDRDFSQAMKYLYDSVFSNNNLILLCNVIAMKEQNRAEKPRSRVKSWNRGSLFYVITLVVILSGSFFLFMRYKHSEIINAFNNDPKSSSPQQFSDPQEKPAVMVQSHQKSPLFPGKQQFSTLEPDPISGQPQDQQQSENALNQQTKTVEQSAQHQKSENSYQQLVSELNAFYTYLDQQPYMKEFHLKEASKTHFSKLLQNLLDNPPAITRETDDYFTLLKNTAHFYRILGKENIFVLKGILDREKDSFEKILKTFYALVDQPEQLKNEFSLTIPADNLYDYAGFFINTIGGRLYLFRRDSASRMTISYYAVLIIDKANEQGNSRLGIDLRPSIDSLIEEMENAGNKLKFKEEYLDTLYDLKEKYGNRG